MNALEKPFISLLWIGTIIVGIGFGVATWRRFGETKQSPETKKTKKKVLA